MWQDGKYVRVCLVEMAEVIVPSEFLQFVGCFGGGGGGGRESDILQYFSCCLHFINFRQEKLINFMLFLSLSHFISL